MDKIIFHGGCITCVSQRLFGVARCEHCKYYNADWNLPDLSTRNETQTKTMKNSKAIPYKLPEPKTRFQAGHLYCTKYSLRESVGLIITFCTKDDDNLYGFHIHNEKNISKLGWNNNEKPFNPEPFEEYFGEVVFSNP